MQPDLTTRAASASTPTAAAGPFGEPCPVMLADGKFVDAAEARVSVSAHALSYGTGTFEGIRAFPAPKDETPTSGC